MEQQNNIKKDSFLLIGGDERTVAAANRLSSFGWDVSVFGFNDMSKFNANVTTADTLQSATRQAEYVILPLPYSSNRQSINTPLYDKTLLVDDLINCLTSAQTVYAGKLDAELEAKLMQKNIQYDDYAQREEFAVLNAIPTAEGAIQIAMQELPYTVNGSNCLVLGFGRIGKILAHTLKGMGAYITASARRYSDLAMIEAYGYKPLPICEIKKQLSTFQIIFNTVPHLLLDRDALRHIPKDCLIIDLASRPGGVDFETAKKLGIKTVHALSLPGKVAPLTAGTIICETILNIIKETEVKQ